MKKKTLFKITKPRTKASTGCPRRGCSIKWSQLPRMKKAA